MDLNLNLIHERNKLIIKLLFSMYLLQLITNVFVLGFSVLYPPVGLILCGVIAFLVWKQISPTLVMYLIVLLIFAYFFYLITDYPYLVNYMFMWFGVILSSLYQNSRVIILAGTLSILLTIYTFFTFHNQIFSGVETVDLVYLILFGLFLTLFLIFYSNFTLNLWKEAKNSREKLNFILDSTNIVTFTFDRGSNQMRVTSGVRLFPNFLGDYKAENAILWENNVHPEDKNIVAKIVDKLHEGNKINAEFRLVDGEKVVWVNCHYIPIEAKDHSVKAVEGVYINITERKLVEENIKHMAYHDYLTGLPNRSKLNDYFSKLSSTLDIKSQQIFLLLIDLDSFKFVNDYYGHDVGDKLLKVAAKRLTCCLREEDITCRLGGDEFVAVINGVPDKKLVTIVERIKTSLGQPFSFDGHEIMTTPSIGISKYSKEENLEKMLKKADIAMYNVKKYGKNDYRFYADSMEVSDTARGQIAKVSI